MERVGCGEIVQGAYGERDLPHKKRHGVGTSEYLNKEMNAVTERQEATALSTEQELQEKEEDKVIEEETENSQDDEDVEETSQVLTEVISNVSLSENEKQSRGRVTELSDHEDEVSSTKERNEEDVTEEIGLSSSGEMDKYKHKYHEDDEETTEVITNVSLLSFTGEEHDEVQQHENQGRRILINLSDTDDEKGVTEQIGSSSSGESYDYLLEYEKQRRRLVIGTDDEVSSTKEPSEDDKEKSEVQTKVNTNISLLSLEESLSGEEHEEVQQKEQQRRTILINIHDEVSSTKNVTEKIGSSSPGEISKHNAASKDTAMSKTMRDVSFYDMNQRRRVLWTSEEEEMLMVGVEKFAADAKKNIPWRKILEWGSKVFYKTRSSSDLKDKWRNMLKAATWPE